jgi:hypothetical protein
VINGISASADPATIAVFGGYHSPSYGRAPFDAASAIIGVIITRYGLRQIQLRRIHAGNVKETSAVRQFEMYSRAFFLFYYFLL